MTARPTPRRALALIAGVLSACAPASPTTAAAPATTTTLLTRLGVDTVAMEQYTRTASRMDGMVVTRTPAPSVARYSVMLGADDAPTSAEVMVRRADGSVPPGGLESLLVRYGADSVTLVGRRATGVDTVRTVAVRGMRTPYINGAWGLVELAVQRLLTAGRDSAEFAMTPLGLGLRAATPLPVTLLRGDSVRFAWFGNPFYARHDGRGGLLWLDGRATTLKHRIDRVAGTDLEALARDWATRAAAGPASTRDTVRATIGTANLWLDYGRPSLRGRDVWQQGVLGDTLWRMGANAATQLRSDVDLLVGGQGVKAGTYSLWMWAGRNGYHLVVNGQSGQWGTAYDPARDLIRVPLRETITNESVERFTMAIEPRGAGAGELVLAWGTRRLSVPISTR